MLVQNFAQYKITLPAKQSDNFAPNKPASMYGNFYNPIFKGGVKPCCLGQHLYTDRLSNLNMDYANMVKNKECSHIYDYTNKRFFNFVAPTEIEENTEPVRESIHLSNDDTLDGSIAASSGFDGTVISTDGLSQCAGLAIVDRQQKIQTLVHCYAWENRFDMKKMLNYIIKDSAPEDLEFSIIPGCKVSTANTVLRINDIINDICPDADINYMDFPRFYKNSENTAILLKNGELSFCDTSMIKNKKVNPLDDIIYYKWKRNEE